MKPWLDTNGEPDTVARRAAATEFLVETLKDGKLWDQVVANTNNDAWKEFRAKGDIDIPANVKIICVDPNLTERDKLVVFIMPPKGTNPTGPIDPLAYWVAAWPPYGHLGRATSAPIKPPPPTSTTT
jgi:hypothetical protein